MIGKSGLPREPPPHRQTRESRSRTRSSNGRF